MGELRYLRLTDEEALEEMERKLREMRRLLEEIRDSLKALGGGSP